MQAVAAPDLSFLEVNIGHAGAAHDSVVFTQSQLRQDLAFGTHPICHQPPYVEEGRVPLQSYLLGDKRYRLQRHLITPYSATAEREHPECREFNYRLRLMRMCVERAFGELKATWRLLCGANRVLVCSEDRINEFVMAAILLHNWFRVVRQELDEDVVRDRAVEIERERMARDARRQEPAAPADEPGQPAQDRTQVRD